MSAGTETWDRDRLCDLVRDKLGGRRLIVVSNREPYEHDFSGDEITWKRPVGGLTEALDPVLRAAGGCWVAHGSGNADRRTVDADDTIAVPPDSPEYTLRRVWLTEAEVEGYYLGFANEALWPLCHIAFTPPVFNDEHWAVYREVNRKFAEAVLREVEGQESVVLVQDYHFALLPAMLKASRPDLVVGQFWHIPWPPYDVFRTCPWREEILHGLCDNDLFGFHIPRFCTNFLDSAEQCLESVNISAPNILKLGEYRTRVEAFPISIDFQAVSDAAASAEVEAEMVRLDSEFNLERKLVLLGMDRMDYTKGIPERLTAYERFLRDNPEYHGRIVFIQAGMPSRTQLGTYQRLGNHVEFLVSSINDTYGTADWRPVVALARQLSYQTLNALRRRANLCVVSSLDDGMNLVAKEYVAARYDGDGALILSEFAGAAIELEDSLLVNPYDTAGFAGAIKTALEMPEADRRRRMERMRAVVADNNIYRWAADLLTRLLEVRRT